MVTVLLGLDPALTLCMLKNAFMLLPSSKLNFKDTFWMQIRTKVLSILIWAKLLAKAISRRQTLPLAGRVNFSIISESSWKTNQGQCFKLSFNDN